ncbi:CHAT domain-containing tetratricopeptide repeat protein [Micromonospora haikouensis]|uniref:CHAT domain-containing tetratricopeptide repeat protein n=1 Tax=Micromonospora haikouensis TaxID=686309 RepID=UPI0037B7EF7F
MTDPHDPDQPPLDEWIDLLLRHQENPPPGADPAGLAGLIGEAFLQRYADEPHDAHLAIAIEQLTRALDGSPHHPDAAGWHYGLGLAHGERARRAAAAVLAGSAERPEGPAVSQDRAVAHLTAAYRGWPSDDPERDAVAVELLDEVWDRFQWHVLDLEPDSPAAHAELDRMERAMAEVAVGDADPHQARYARMLGGLARLARYDYAGGRRPDLDEGVAQLTAALAALPPETPRYLVASDELVAGYLELTGLDQDRNCLDLAIAVGDRAIRAARPGQPGWLSLHRSQAYGYATRWDLDRDPADVAAAIRCWRTVRAEDPDAASAVALAELLHSRAELTEESDGLAEAVELLDGALPEAAEAGPVWQRLGEIHLLRWQRGREPGSLAAAGDCLDRALRGGLPAEALFAVHRTRLVVAWETTTHEETAEPGSVPPGLGRLRRVVQEATDALHAATGATPTERATLAGLILFAECTLIGIVLDDADLPHLRSLLAIARTADADPSPGFTGAMDLVEGVLDDAAASSSTDSASDFGVTKLAAALNDRHLDEPDALRGLTRLALLSRGARLGDLRSFRAGAGRLDGSTDAAEGDAGRTDAEFELVEVAFHIIRHGARRDFAAMREAIRRADELRDRIGPSRTVRQLIDPMLDAGRSLYAMNTHGPLPSPGSPVPLPAGRLSARTVATMAVNAAVQLAVARRWADHGLLRRWADHLVGVADRLEPTDRMSLVLLSLAAKAELWRAAALRERAAAARAARYLARARAAGPDSAGSLWAELVGDHAEALRRSGDPDRAATRRLGLAGLRARARDVLLQSGTDQALEAARSAADAATRVVRWCLQDEADDDLLAALDAGRSLTLQASTAGRTVPELLGRAGRADLAAEWEQSGGLGRDQVTGDLLGAVVAASEVPDDLRPRVLSALEDAGLLDDLLPPLRPDDVRAALRALDLDALVYLVPAAPGVPGLAVLVPATGEILPQEFPDLTVAPGAPVRRLLAAALGPTGTGPRVAGPVGGDVGETGADVAATRIDDLCRWAWRAVLGRLVDDLRALRPGRPARVALVPMGLLGLVPWHAAYEQTATGRRYAMHDLVVSYTPSARMLCATAARPARPVRSALVVGDPLGDLRYAGVEAHAVYERFYPDGDYLGAAHPDPGRRATRENVLSWLRTAGVGPSMLHFACHGRVDPALPADAHLVLADGPLPAREMLEVSRRAALDLGQVFLAACTTNVVGGDHDEAFSLATAFLAAGAHTVFGSLWRVPDDGTSLLMYVVHHLLRQGHAPADALHRAQLWMLDPDRRPPAGMPPELAAACGGASLAQPLSWAAFTHLGW